jgi:hypothetical protein
MYNIYSDYQALKKRIDDLTDEVDANGGATGLYGSDGANFPEQPDGFTYDQMVDAFLALTALIGAPTSGQKSAIIVCRR